MFSWNSIKEKFSPERKARIDASVKKSLSNMDLFEKELQEKRDKSHVYKGQRLNRGDMVKMTQELKDVFIFNSSDEHVEEFGNCVGIVQGLTDYNGQQGPEVDVKWIPSDLRYAYHPECLIKLADNTMTSEEACIEKMDALLEGHGMQIALKAFYLAIESMINRRGACVEACLISETIKGIYLGYLRRYEGDDL